MDRRPKRFYKSAGVTTVKGQYQLALDTRAARTPGGRAFVLPTLALADAVAAEWERQEDRISFHLMPLTKLAATTLDHIACRRDETVDGLLAYVDGDVLCYRTESPEDLVSLQMSTWQPLLEWAATELDVCLETTTVLRPLRQPSTTVASLRRFLTACDDFTLTGLAAIAQTAGSLLIGLAVTRGRLDADAAFRAAFVDECYQADRWGGDPEAELRRQRLAAELGDADLFIRLAHARAR
ncbi:MAG: ATPase [Rhodospirillales bacterium]|nr:ATPase [Rhodospirillales bacterium]